MENKSQSERRHSAGALLAVACGAPFLVALDLFVVNVAFDDIAEDFGGAQLTAVSWTLSAYAIVYAALLIPLGAASDRLGNRRGFIGGVVVFTAASALAACAPTLGVLIAARVLQAVGAAALTPASLALLVTSVPPERRAGAVRIWAATSGMAAALGPVVGGILVEFSWRAAFLINVPIGIAFVIAAVRVFGRDSGVQQQRSGAAVSVGMLTGAVLLAASSALGVLYLVQGDEWGWGSARAIAVLVAAVILGVAFVFIDRRSDDPLIPTRLFSRPEFSFGTAAMLLFSIAFAAGLLDGILLLQKGWGYSVIRSGLAVAPGPLMVPVAAVLVSRMATTVSPWLLAAAGAGLWAIGMVLIGISTDASDPNYAAGFLPGWLLGGFGVGLVIPALIATATSGLDAAIAGRGSAVITMSRQLGTTIGTSALVAMLGAGVTTGTWWVCAAFAAGATILALGPLVRRTSGQARAVAASNIG
ncbi:MFS transporter [Gordonia jacobaea]|uniref:MFS transporter n=1 Tax=Gordonia jacobaea TaxID=122202 RepID=UPI003D70B029